MAGSGSGTPVTPVFVGNVNVSDWYPEVIPAAQLCPNPIINREIISTCRDLCDRTMLWTAELTPISVVADQAEYPLAASGADISGVDRATHDGKTIHATSETALDQDDTQEDRFTWRTQTADKPERYYGTFDKKIRLVYIPNTDLASGLKVWVNIVPLINATVVPAFLWENFKDMIAEGAKGRLKAIADMPWTDLQLAATFLGSYEFQMIAAKQKKFSGFQRVKTRAIVRTRYHDF
jgi:hypothetical protein